MPERPRKPHAGATAGSFVNVAAMTAWTAAAAATQAVVAADLPGAQQVTPDGPTGMNLTALPLPGVDDTAPVEVVVGAVAAVVGAACLLLAADSHRGVAQVRPAAGNRRFVPVEVHVVDQPAGFRQVPIDAAFHIGDHDRRIPLGSW